LRRVEIRQNDDIGSEGKKDSAFLSCFNRLRQISGPNRGERLRLAGKKGIWQGQLAIDKRLQTATRGDVKTACVPACVCTSHSISCLSFVDRSIVATDDDDNKNDILVANVTQMFLTHRKKGAPPWKSDSSYATRCAMGHVKIRSELSSRSARRVVCYEISRPQYK